ncbi:MAG TPA: tetratricopeptide repeat protein, partial [Desulfatiglandales bacterium]|nr:tetratricopeptide repeat protein [Desulfatiglandales bacterium]
VKPSPDYVRIARALFYWLWAQKPARHEHGGSYRLNEVIDSQLSKEDEAVGNCLGLTLLYNCLLRRAGINAGAVHLENAFGKGPHVLSSLRIQDSIIDIENSLSQGFDYKGHLKDPSRHVWGDRELVADIYLSRGNDYFELGNYDEALASYETAVSLNPRYERAVLNRAIVVDKMGVKG